MDFNICTWFFFFQKQNPICYEDILDIYYDNLKVIMMWQDVCLKMRPTSADCTLQPPLTGQNHLNDTKLVKLKYMTLGYRYPITHGMYMFLSPLIVTIAT